MFPSLARVVRYRDCLVLLTVRAIKVRYRRSVLGFAWSMLYPLISMLVLTVVFSRVFPTVTNYPLYVVTGVLVWGFVSLSCVQGMDSLISGAAVLRRVYVPPAVFPLAVVGANFIHLLLSIAVLPVVMFVTHTWPGFHPLRMVVGIGCLVVFTIGLVLLLAACNLLFRDVRYFVEALLLVWFYASPIVYPQSVIPDDLRLFLWANPLFWLLGLLRGGLYPSDAPTAAAVGVGTVFSGAMLLVGWAVFSRLERRFYLYL